MRYHADFFRGQLRAPLGTEKLGSIRLAEWANSSSATLTAPASVGYPQTLQSLSSLRPLFTFEASRFASAALESYSTARSKWSDPEDRDGLAWMLVSLYYSAYYSAHAILRLSGMALTQVDSWRRIEGEFMNLYATLEMPNLGFSSGYHLMKLDDSGTAIDLSKANVDSGNGSHLALWKEFKRFSDNCYSNNSLNTTFHQEAISVYTGKLTRPIILDGKSCSWPWLPAVRNSVNYRLPDEIWGAGTKRIPPRVNSRLQGLVKSPTSLEIVDGLDSDSEWIRFSASCMYMLSLLCGLLRDMEIRSNSKALLPAIFQNREPIITALLR